MNPFYSTWSKPTIQFCEANFSGWVAQPANSISSLIISLAGLWILNRKKHKLSKWLGWTAIMVGVFSFVYHASYTFAGQLLDLGSMFLLASFLIVAALRTSKLSEMTKLLILLLGTMLPLALTTIFRTIGGFNLGIPLFALLLIVAIYLELKTAAKERRSLGLFGGAFIVFILGWLIWWLDLTRLWCSPMTYHYLNGHAIWHAANALALLMLNDYYVNR